MAREINQPRVPPGSSAGGQFRPWPRARPAVTALEEQKNSTRAEIAMLRKKFSNSDGLPSLESLRAAALDSAHSADPLLKDALADANACPRSYSDTEVARYLVSPEGGSHSHGTAVMAAVSRVL